MKHIASIFLVSLMLAACAGSDSDTSTTATTSITSMTSSTTITTAPPETTTSTSAVHTPSTEAWGTWTLVLASIEIGAGGGQDRAQEIADGIEGAEVIYSGDFPSLNPGFWVVHWGEFESGSEAGTWCAGLANALTCYPRYLGAAVSPLAADGHALVVDGQALVIVDVETGGAAESHGSLLRRRRNGHRSHGA